MVSANDLLRRASIIAEREKAIKRGAFLRGERFNVFRMCHVDHYENKHSSIIAEWLNPKGTHGQGDLFLKLFLDAVGDARPGGFRTGTAKVSTEVTIDQGRLDLLLEDQAGNAIIVENKIYAADQDAQLKRYDQFAQKKYGPGRYALLYLTLFGDNANGKSGEGVAYSTISYQGTILGWLRRCIKEVCDKPFLRESLTQYGNLVKQLTGQDMDERNSKDLVAEMLREPEGVAAIIKASLEWENTVLREALFVPLQKYAEENDLGFEVSESFWTKSSWGLFKFIVQPKLSIVFQYERQGRNSFYYGITDERLDKRIKKTLPGLQGGNDTWRYGWCYLDGIYRNWTVDTVARIAKDSEELLACIKNAVERLLKEMKENSIL